MPGSSARRWSVSHQSRPGVQLPEPSRSGVCLERKDAQLLTFQDPLWPVRAFLFPWLSVSESGGRRTRREVLPERWPLAAGPGLAFLERAPGVACSAFQAKSGNGEGQPRSWSLFGVLDFIGLNQRSVSSMVVVFKVCLLLFFNF